MHKLFGEPIYSYSRAQAINDGVLVDISAQAQQQRFVYPVAITSALWERCKDPDNVKHVLAQLHLEIKKAVQVTDQLKFFALGFTIKSVVGPGDCPKPVITLMLEHED